MRTTLENNRTYGQRHHQVRYSVTRQTLTDTYRISSEGSTYQFLNPNGSNRTVFLPAYTPEGGSLYWIANTGTGELFVVDANGVAVRTLTSGVVAAFLESFNGWRTTPVEQEVLSITDFGADTSSADNAAAINAALVAAAAGGRALRIPGGIFLISSPINIPLNMTLGRIFGDSLHAILKASPSFVGSAMMVGVATLSLLTLQNFTLDASNIASIGIDLTRTPESSIQHNIDNVKILQLPTGSTGLVLDGCEDSTLNRVSISNNPGATGVKAIKWLVPFGNAWIHDSIFIGDVGGLPIYLSCQNGEIARTTHGAIVADTGGVGTLSLTGTYGYADRGTTKANFFVAGASTFGAIDIAGCYFNNNQQLNVVAFQGAYSDVVKITASYFDSTGVAGYTLFSAATTAFAGTTPSFEIEGLTLVSTTAFGAPGTGVSISRRWFGKAGFGTLTSIYPVEVNINQNASTVLGVTNSNAGAGAGAQVILQALGTQGIFSANSPASGGNFGINWDGIGAIRYGATNAVGAHEWYTGAGFIRRMLLSTAGALTLDAYGTGILHSSSAGLLTSSAVSLTADVTGILPVANGGTGVILPALILGGVAANVNLNSAATDTAIAITLPAGSSSYTVAGVLVKNKGTTASLNTATAGLFTATGGAGLALAADQALSGITSNTVNTDANLFQLVTTVGGRAWINSATLQFRVGTAQGAAATADVYVYIRPMP